MTTENWSISTPQTLEVDGVADLRAAVVRGRLDVITHNEPTTRIEVTEVSGPPLEVEFSDGILRIDHLDSGGWLKKLGNLNSMNRAVISIAVPSGIDVSAATVSGDGLVCGTSARTAVKTVSGSVMTDDTTGTLTADTVSGEIITRHHRGPLVAKSVSGEITASGFLSDVRASTVSGDMTFDMLGVPEDLSFKSVSGDVTVRLADDVGVQVESKSTSGTIIIDDQRFSGTAQTVRASSGPAANMLKLRTTSVSGSVAVVHRGPAPETSSKAGMEADL
ncbi:DUF4097 family beta strand repeat protein [Paenarthrobacter sp. Z7-10]|uniref:DUF4097 family beta strand repeat-containing protein n=1 Tax=Paenarthrobacter sp. Z7-10 TaxID=2787635 RepID=UPI0022A9D447|nr:DUF4097 family beta strand repeat-containing protein [Paenarthrobacter sp. Z7-10]MCZ2402463.1 DUF4097 family beta strand repeat protein [Paenarthrobacter sp. Z7-10]